jgi:hypothetical protein
VAYGWHRGCIEDHRGVKGVSKGWHRAQYPPAWCTAWGMAPLYPSESPTRYPVRMKRRKLNLKAKFESGPSHVSFNRLVPAPFNAGLIGSTCTALPGCHKAGATQLSASAACRGPPATPGATARWWTTAGQGRPDIARRVVGCHLTRDVMGPPCVPMTWHTISARRVIGCHSTRDVMGAPCVSMTWQTTSARHVIGCHSYAAN